MFAGGWSEFCALNPQEEALFQKTMTLKGVDYKPFAVATQLVNGTNYKFLCNATTVTNPPRLFLAQVVIYQPLQGEAVITNISELD